MKRFMSYFLFFIFGFFLVVIDKFLPLSKYEYQTTQLYFGMIIVLISIVMILFYRCYIVLKTFDYFYFFISYLLLIIIIFTILIRQQTYMGFRIFYDNIIKYTEIIFWTWGMFIVREKTESKKFNIVFSIILFFTLMCVVFFPQESLEKLITLIIYLELLYMCIITHFKLKKDMINVLIYKILAEFCMVIFYYTQSTPYLIMTYIFYINSFIKLMHYLNINLNRGHFRKLLEKERKIKKIIEFSGDGIIISEDYLISRINNKALKILEFRKDEEVIGKNIFSAIDGMKKEDIEKALKNYPDSITITSKKYGEVEKKYRISCNKFKGFDSDNLIIMIKDIYEIKQELLYKFNDDLKAFVFIYQDHYGYKFINSAVNDIFGYRSKDIYENPEILKNIAIKENDEDYIDIFKSRKEMKDREIRLKNIKGNEIYMIANSSKIKYEDKEFYYFVGVDISLQKNKEIELINKNKELEEENIKKEMGMSIVSHEIRTPITAIIGFVENIIINKNKIPDNILKMVEKVYNNGIRLKELINNLLDYNKINVGKMEVYPEIIDTKELIEEIIINNEMLMEIKNISVKNRLQNDIKVYIDSSMFYQIINNIVSNAIKYTNKGGIIELENGIVENEVFIKIIDNGIGINEYDKDRIFKAYERVKGIKEKGTGLGLALTQKLVKVNNGKIKFESELGKGTCFYLYFPLK